MGLELGCHGCMFFHCRVPLRRFFLAPLSSVFRSLLLSCFARCLFCLRRLPSVFRSLGARSANLLDSFTADAWLASLPMGLRTVTKNNCPLLVRILEGSVVWLGPLQDPCPDVFIFNHIYIGHAMARLMLHKGATLQPFASNDFTSPSQTARAAFSEVNVSAVLRARASYFPCLFFC